MVDEAQRLVTCRGAWMLRSVDVNDANQVHTFICDLRKLPIQEQKHWASRNEEPRARISNRTIANDFLGTVFDWSNPLRDVRLILQKWMDEDVQWWGLDDASMLLHVNTR